MALTFFTHDIFRMAAMQSPQGGPSVGMPFQVTSGELIHGMPWAAAFPFQNISRTVTTFYPLSKADNQSQIFPISLLLSFAICSPSTKLPTS